MSDFATVTIKIDGKAVSLTVFDEASPNGRTSVKDFSTAQKASDCYDHYKARIEAGKVGVAS